MGVQKTTPQTNNTNNTPPLLSIHDCILMMEVGESGVSLLAFVALKYFWLPEGERVEVELHGESAPYSSRASCGGVRGPRGVMLGGRGSVT